MSSDHVNSLTTSTSSARSVRCRLRTGNVSPLVGSIELDEDDLPDDSHVARTVIEDGAGDELYASSVEAFV